MKIIISVHSLKNGGAERVAVSVANGLLQLGHKVSIVTEKKEVGEYKVDDGIEIIRWQDTRDFRERKSRYTDKIKGRLYFYKFIKKVLKEEKPDAIVNILGYRIEEQILAARSAKVKLVFSDHNSYERPEDRPLGLYQKFLKFKLSRLCDITTVLTTRDKELLPGRKDVEVMWNPLFLKPLPEVSRKNKTILAVGRQNEWHYKGFDILIKAWGMICKDFPEWQLKIKGAGTKESLEFLEGLKSEHNAERTALEDFSLDIEKDYAESEVFVLSSRYEGFGLVLTEAMSRHCACIACDYKGRQADIITDGVDGLLCETDNVEALVAKLREVLENENLRKSLQQHSADNLDRFSEENVSRNWEKLLENLVK